MIRKTVKTVINLEKCIKLCCLVHEYHARTFTKSDLRNFLTNQTKNNNETVKHG
jgi:hypothetical protein